MIRKNYLFYFEDDKHRNEQTENSGEMSMSNTLPTAVNNKKVK